jgi:hypothetical protein
MHRRPSRRDAIRIGSLRAPAVAHTVGHDPRRRATGPAVDRVPCRRGAAGGGERCRNEHQPKYPHWPDLTDEEGDALTAWFDLTCGDCVEGRCHWGGERSRESIAAVKAGREYVDPVFGECGCDRHADSVAVRRYKVEDRDFMQDVMAWWKDQSG